MTRFLVSRSHAAIAAQLKYQQPSLSSEFCNAFVLHLLDLTSKAVLALKLVPGAAASTATAWPDIDAGLVAHLVYGLREWSTGKTLASEELYVCSVDVVAPFCTVKSGVNMCYV